MNLIVNLKGCLKYSIKNKRTKFNTISPYFFRKRRQISLQYYANLSQAVISIPIELMISRELKVYINSLNLFSTNVPFVDKPGSWFLLAKCLKNTCGRVTF